MIRDVILHDIVIASGIRERQKCVMIQDSAACFFGESHVFLRGILSTIFVHRL